MGPVWRCWGGLSPLPAPALALAEPAPPRYGAGTGMLGQRGKEAVSKSGWVFFHLVKEPSLTPCCWMVNQDPRVPPRRAVLQGRAALRLLPLRGEPLAMPKGSPHSRAWCRGCRCPVALGEALGCGSGCSVCPWAQPVGIAQAPLPVPSPPVLPLIPHGTIHSLLPPPWAPSSGSEGLCSPMLSARS